MPYVKVYETTIKADLEKACEIFEEEDISYEVLHEYRLYREKIHDPIVDQGAIIRVPKSVFHDADRLLIEIELKKKDEKKTSVFLLIQFIDRFSSTSSEREKALMYIIIISIIILIVVLVFFGLLDTIA